MKLESITVENYRQFEKAELTFDEGITILAGANNSGKTSLINLIKNIFVDDKLNYNMSDIPAKNMREWVEWVYPIFQKFFRDRKTEENVEKDLLNVVIPKEETDSTHLMKMTTVKIHVSYNPDMDDITILKKHCEDEDFNVSLYSNLLLENYSSDDSFKYIRNSKSYFDEIPNRGHKLFIKKNRPSPWINGYDCVMEQIELLSERLEVDGEHLEKRVADYCDKIPDQSGHHASSDRVADRVHPAAWSWTSKSREQRICRCTGFHRKLSE